MADWKTRTDWGIVATVKAPVPQVLAFVAWHLDLGATEIRLYFDTPDDPAVGVAGAIPGVIATRCDDAHWQRLNGRPDAHQPRQSKNARHAYRATRLPWIAHMDVDEFLLPSQPLPEILGRAHPDQAMVRAAPFEAMHDPGLTDDIFTARAFRGSLRGLDEGGRRAVLGRYAPLLPLGLLSHSIGKAFFRTGIPGLSPRIHGAFLHGERIEGPPFAQGLRLLHFHAQNRADWLAALPYRTTRGVYRTMPALQAFLGEASPAELEAFYSETQMLTPAKMALLRDLDLVAEADLGLAARVAALPVGV